MLPEFAYLGRKVFRLTIELADAGAFTSSGDQSDSNTHRVRITRPMLRGFEVRQYAAGLCEKLGKNLRNR